MIEDKHKWDAFVSANQATLDAMRKYYSEHKTMQIEPINLADFSLVEVKSTNSNQPTPHCKKHGAMNKITSEGIWRCISVSGYKVSMNGNSIAKTHQETICRAGCAQK